MAVKNTIAPIVLTSIDSSTFTGAYQLVSASTGISNAISIIRIINNSNKDITISYDGTHDHDFLPTLNTLSLSFQTNSQPNNFLACLPKGTKIYVKGVAGTGFIYLAGYYSPNSTV